VDLYSTNSADGRGTSAKIFASGPSSLRSLARSNSSHVRLVQKTVLRTWRRSWFLSYLTCRMCGGPWGRRTQASTALNGWPPMSRTTLRLSPGFMWRPSFSAITRWWRSTGIVHPLWSKDQSTCFLITKPGSVAMGQVQSTLGSMCVTPPTLLKIRQNSAASLHRLEGKGKRLTSVE